MTRSTAKATVKKVTRGAKKVSRQAAKATKTVTGKAGRTAKTVKQITGKKLRHSKTTLNKAAVVIGSALGKAVGRIEKALK